MCAKKIEFCNSLFIEIYKLKLFIPEMTSTEQRIKELLRSRTKIHECEQHVGEEVSVLGWVMFVRKQNKRYFLKVYDSRRSRFRKILQIMFEKTPETQDYFSQLDHVTIGCSLLVKGLIVESPAKGQKIEMKGQEYHIIGTVHDASTFPSSKSELTMDYIRSIEHLECHTQLKSAIYSVRSTLELGIEKFFEMEDFAKSDMPLITFSECEGGCQPMQTTLFLTSGKLQDIPIITTLPKESIEYATLSERFASLDQNTPMLLVDFSKDFFGKKSCLTVSAQLELETHLAQGSIWTMTRAVRGEPSQTTRHLTEFSMIELEQISADSQDIIDISTKFIKFSMQYALDNCQEELEYLESYYKKPIFSRLSQFIQEDFAVITHAQVVTLCREQAEGTFVELPSYDADLGSEHEKFIADIYFKKPTIIRFYPKCVKAFYMPVITETLEESHGVEHVDSFDIIVPDVGELVGGSQRIHKYDDLIGRIHELGLDPEPLKFYTDLRKAGTVPHGGMGMGFERLIKFITCAESVKDCVAYPRYIGCGRKH